MANGVGIQAEDLEFLMARANFDDVLEFAMLLDEVRRIPVVDSDELFYTAPTMPVPPDAVTVAPEPKREAA
jgi:hypothetical protein